MIFFWSRGGGVTCDTVLNVVRVIRDANDKKTEITEQNRAARAAKKAADIANQMTLGKANVEKLEAIEDNNKRLEAVRKLTNPRMVAILVVYEKTIRV